MSGQVEVTMIPGKRSTVTIEGPTTVKGVFEAIGKAYDGRQIRVNGEEADAGAEVKAGDRVTATSAPRGA